MDLHLLVERADEEVVLVVLPDLAGVGQSVDVHLVVGGLPGNGNGNWGVRHRADLAGGWTFP